MRTQDGSSFDILDGEEDLAEHDEMAPLPRLQLHSASSSSEVSLRLSLHLHFLLSLST